MRCKPHRSYSLTYSHYACHQNNKEWKRTALNSSIKKSQSNQNPIRCRIRHIRWTCLNIVCNFDSLEQTLLCCGITDWLDCCTVSFTSENDTLISWKICQFYLPTKQIYHSDHNEWDLSYLLPFKWEENIIQNLHIPSIMFLIQ